MERSGYIFKKFQFEKELDGNFYPLEEITSTYSTKPISNDKKSELENLD